MIAIFSYWIFFWFLLFYFGIIKANPLILLCIGYFLTFLEIFYLIFKKTNTYNIKKFFIINVIIKFIPILIILITIKYDMKNLYNDIQFTLLVILIYLITMSILNINIIKTYLHLLQSYYNDEKEKRTYISKLYDYIYKNYFLNI